MKTPSLFWTCSTATLLLAGVTPARSHPTGHAYDAEIHALLAAEAASSATTTPGAASEPTRAAATSGLEFLTDAFARFAPVVRTRSDAQYFYIESEGMPNHQLMVGITTWINQIPLPQDFTGTNAFRLPLAPQLSATPFTFDQVLPNNAIGVAVNGVPIFPALNASGLDSNLIGELDQWGGHCGRGDDYHYHAAPIHLTALVGASRPIGFSFDGFPLFGLTEPDGSAVSGLDKYNGHFAADGSYHYHATRTFPYIHFGFRGVVNFTNGQVNPQPRTNGTEPAIRPPTQITAITGFTSPVPDTFVLTYTRAAQSYTITYTVDRTRRTVTYAFTDPSGVARTENWVAPPPAQPSGNGRLTNLSLRAIAGAGTRTLIVGFGLGGTGAKPLLLRGVGPALGAFGISGALADPRLQLYSSTTMLAQNQGWSGNDGRTTGAFALPTGSMDAALETTLGPGSYTAQISSAGATTAGGEALAEIYDTAAGDGTLSLTNLSARTELQASQPLIAGFTLGGTGLRTLLVRAIGPGLAGFGVTGTLADPRVAIYEGNVLVADNDNWGGHPALTTAMQAAGAFPLPAASKDAAFALRLRPGAYSLHVSGVTNETGVVLVEVYDVTANEM